MFEYLSKADSLGQLENSPITSLRLLHLIKNMGENTLELFKTLKQLNGAVIWQAKFNGSLIHTLRSGGMVNGLAEVDGCQDCGSTLSRSQGNSGVGAGSSQQAA